MMMISGLATLRAWLRTNWDEWGSQLEAEIGSGGFSNGPLPLLCFVASCQGVSEAEPLVIALHCTNS